MTIELRRYQHDGLPEGFRQLMLDVHDDAYADRRHEPFVQRWSWFLDRWSSKPGFVCVVAFDGAEPVGFTYGAPMADGAEWWRPFVEPAPARTATFAVSELMLRPRWRGQGVSQQLHEALLDGRPEALAVLSVDTARPKVQALYESWSYRKVGEEQPFEDSPLYAIMLRDLGTETERS
ncbi:GNAT family N-acetyltransferase [Kitasatospora sp. NPDC059160]|uniref:GNAT family N-acetyltransferase n=1 Tax=Kitasatospora sp. NPDC059160 TaxID=3346748 RepID=UPI0036A2D4E3